MAACQIVRRGTVEALREPDVHEPMSLRLPQLFFPVRPELRGRGFDLSRPVRLPVCEVLALKIGRSLEPGIHCSQGTPLPG